MPVPNAMEYNTYDDGKSFVYNVDDINNFQITIEFPMIADWEDDKTRSRFQDRLHDDTIQLLRTSEFYSESRLEQSKFADHFAIEYSDDVNDFKISCYQNRIVIQKRGIRMESFHRWYFSAAPSFRVLVHSLIELMEQVLERKLAITDVHYYFGFILYDFRKDGRLFKNYEVLKRLVTKVPSDTGMIQDVDEGNLEISRADYKVSCWDVSADGDRRLISYSVEAPANREYSGLWFTFAYGSGTYTDPKTGKREWTQPDRLLDEHEKVYEFIWKRGVKGFIKSLLDGLTFKSTTTYIP